MEKKSFYSYSKFIFFVLGYMMPSLVFISSCSDDSENYNSGRESLVTGWNSQSGSSVFIHYDEKKRPTKIGDYYILYNITHDDLGRELGTDDPYLKLIGKNGFYSNYSFDSYVFELNKQGYITTIMDSYSFVKEPTSCPYTTYSYNKDGYLTDVKRYGYKNYGLENEKMELLNHCILEWSKGNLVHYYTADGRYESYFTYGDELNKSQIYPVYVNKIDGGISYDDYHELYGSDFMNFSNAGLLGKTSRNLMKAKTWNNTSYDVDYGKDPTNSYEYELNEDGYVISYVVTNETTSKSSKVFFTYK